jgi:hypothetical protein
VLEIVDLKVLSHLLFLNALLGFFRAGVERRLCVEIRNTSEKQKIIFECPVSKRH